MGDEFVNVHSAWDGWRTATVRIADLRGVHWHRPSCAPASILHAYIDCTRVAAGALPHECDAGSRPHRLLVCVLKRHAAATAYMAVAGRAGVRETEAIEVEPMALVALERRRGLRVRLPIAGAVGAAAALILLGTWRARRRRKGTRPFSRAFSFGRLRAASA